MGERTSTKGLTPLQYARQEFIAERFPQMIIVAVHDRFALADSDFNFLAHDLFDRREQAERYRSRTLDKARTILIRDGANA